MPTIAENPEYEQIVVVSAVGATANAIPKVIPDAQMYHVNALYLTVNDSISGSYGPGLGDVGRWRGVRF
jgi:hypothetical protein